MRIFLTALNLLVCVFGSSPVNLALGQEAAGPGQWRDYFSHTDFTQVVARGSWILGINNVMLAAYDCQTEEYSHYTMINGLSDNRPNALYYDAHSDYVFVGHQSGMVEKFRTAGNFTPIPDILISENVVRKAVTCFAATPQFLYIGGEFGIVAYRVTQGESVFNYSNLPLGSGAQPGVRQMEVWQDTLYALLDNGNLIKGSTQVNLNNPANWTHVNSGTLLPADTVQHIAARSWGLFVQTTENAYVSPNAGSWTTLADIPPFPLQSISKIAAHTLLLHYDLENQAIWQFDGEKITPFAQLDRRVRQVARAADGTWGVADGFLGLTTISPNDNSLQAHSPFHPRTNQFRNLKLVGNRLYMTGCKIRNNFNICFDRTSVHSMVFPTKGMDVQDKDGQFDDITEWWDLADISTGREANEAFISAWRTGIMRFRDGRYVDRYDNQNSCLSGVLQDGQGVAQAIQIADMAVDEAGVLWTAGYRTEEPFASILPDGTCRNHQLPAGASDRLNTLLIDDTGQKWIGTTVGGIIVWKSNNQAAILNSSNTNLAANNIRCITKDRNGQIWVGTSNGVTVFFEPHNALSQAHEASCPLVDGFCLLRNTEILDIQVDDFNRKWIATPRNGLYLTNPSGTEIIAHFQFRSSGLLDETIHDIEYVGHSGELFVATSRGVISYKTDTKAAAESNRELFVYPNPIYSDHSGAITIDNTAENSRVVVLNASGLLVRELSAKAGRATWDGLDIQGRKIRPGVYVVLADQSDTRTRGATKFVVLNQRTP